METLWDRGGTETRKSIEQVIWPSTSVSCSRIKPVMLAAPLPGSMVNVGSYPSGTAV